MSKKTKRYLKGSAKLRTFEDGGELINVDLNLEDLSSLPITESGYIKITLSRKKEVDQYGNAYSIFENDFVPDKSKAPAKPKVATVKHDRPPFGDSPF